MSKKMVANLQILSGGMFMNAVGIDISKGKCTVAVMRPLGEVVRSPFEVSHTGGELSALAETLRGLRGETKVIMECTGNYHFPVAYTLREYGLEVYAVHAKLIQQYGNNSIRKVKTDKADAVKIANYGLSNWFDMQLFAPEDELRQMLKAFSRQYSKYMKIKTSLTNNLISLLDQTFPGVNELFTSPSRKSDGHEKWLDFTARFWHCGCVCDLTPKAFAERYRKWCKRSGYYFSQGKAEAIYVSACGHVSVMPKTEVTKLLIQQAVSQINAIAETVAIIAAEMQRIAKLLPEYPVVSTFYGVGEILAPQLMAEVGDIYRFDSKRSLVCFAGLEPENSQSGKVAVDGEISKKGSPHLRKEAFQVIGCLIKTAPADNAVYQFLDRKRSEGKHYYSYMNAAAAKFLRIYYARVKEYLDKLNPDE
jgi:transposase